MLALVDCNNFFVSCERVFNPSLKHKPVVVLSNNDGCVIARSQQAKDIGIAMGEPFFKCAPLISRYGVQVFSANFVLYGDMSDRVMSTLAASCDQIEIYSIDEAFVGVDGHTHVDKYIDHLRTNVMRSTGIPVSIGVAKTKTLAKIANRIAKKYAKQGTFCLTEQAVINHWLEKTDVGDVWGIGRQKAEFLRRQGIDNAWQLIHMPDVWIKKELTVMTLRTVMELRGTPCVEMEDVSEDKKSIITSRTFGHEVSALEILEEAVCAYTAKAAEKLRQQQSVCGYMQVYVTSNRFKGEQYYTNAASIDITPSTAYTPQLMTIAKSLLNKIYNPNLSYKKAGIMLMHLTDERHVQGDLFDEDYHQSRKQRLMSIVDGFNQQVNEQRIFLASQGMDKPWWMKQAHKSQRFTTRWDELLEIKS